MAFLLLLGPLSRAPPSLCLLYPHPRGSHSMVSAEAWMQQQPWVPPETCRGGLPCGECGKGKPYTLMLPQSPF